MKATKKKSTASFSEKQPTNKLRIIKTSDDKEFKVIDALLMKYSSYFKNIMEDEKSEDEPIKINEVDSEAFEVINEFLQLHKDKETQKIDFPLKTNQDLKLVAEEGDSVLVEKVLEKGDEFLLKILEASSFLEIEELKKRLMAGLFIKLSKSTVREHKEAYNILENEHRDEEIRDEVKKRLHHISEMKES